jgi:hypothetical protein
LHDGLDVLFAHGLADLPVDDGAAEPIQDRAEIVERAADVEVGDVDVPMLVGPRGLMEALALARRCTVPAVEPPRQSQNRYVDPGLTATTSRSSIMKVRRRYPSSGNWSWKARIASRSPSSSQ